MHHIKTTDFKTVPFILTRVSVELSIQVNFQYFNYMSGDWYVVEYKDSLFPEVIGIYTHQNDKVFGISDDITGNGQIRGTTFIMRYKMVKALYKPDVT